MVGSAKLNRKKDIYCEHTCPRYFHALHFENSSEVKETMEICGYKVTNKLVLLMLGFIADTIWLIFSIVNPVVRLFGGNLITTEENKIQNDYRCELCKKEASK